MKNFLLLSLAVTATILNSCNNKQSNIGDYEKLLTSSLNVQDYESAIVALQFLLSNDSTKMEYYDSLANFYFYKVNNYQAADKIANKILNKKADNVNALEIAAMINKGKNQKTKALDQFNKLHTLTNDPKYLYQIASVYYNSGQEALTDDIEKSDSVVNIILAKNLNNEFLVEEYSPKGNKQNVSLNAACYFVKAAVIKNQLERLAMQGKLNPNTAQFKTNIEKMSDYLNKSLQISPDFDLALYFKEQLKGM